MISFATFAILVLALVPGHSATSLQYKIIGGIQVSIVQCPHQVSVRVNDLHRCGGSILDANTVLTAAHCVYNTNFFTISVRIGSSNNKKGKSIKVRQMFIHPYYNRPRFNNDVAILKLQENLIFSAAVQPIALQPPGAEVRPGTKAHVCGWGDIIEGSGNTPDILRVTDVTVLSDFECMRIYGPKVFTSAMMCTRNGYKGPCQGDSGGALIANGRLIGVVSWGVRCAQFGYPEVYAKVSNLYYWINYYK